MYMPNSRWTWSFFGVTLVQACIVLALEGYVFGRFQISLKNGAQRVNDSRTIPTYLSLLIFGLIYELLLVYDALRLKNTIQIIGLCIYNLGILVYTAIQMGQIKDAVGNLARDDHIDGRFYGDIRPYVVAVPCVVGLFTLLMSFIAKKLYEEFAWTIYKHISADVRLKRRFLIYQIYIALLKFDFFFFLGFTVQFLVIVVNTPDAEFYLTIAAVPITIILLLLAAYWTRKESVAGMICIILLYIAALAYFLFKLVRMYAGGRRAADYTPARRTLTTFAVITLLLLILTVVVACWCTHNFGKGLKPHIQRRKVPDADDPVAKAWAHGPGAPGVPMGGLGGGGSRMEID